MNKFRWGGFDKHEAFVDQSYMPSVSSIRFAMLRLANKLVQRGDRERATKLIDKQFEVFPHMNFPPDYNAMYMLRLYGDVGAEENAKPHILTLAKEAQDRMEFYDSLSDTDRSTHFKSESENWVGIMMELYDMVSKNLKYADIRVQVEEMLSLIHI